MSGGSIFDLQVEVPGGMHARYYPDTGGLSLAQVIYPANRFPADRCAVTDTLTEAGSALGALLLGNLSQPAGCRLQGRPIGAVEISAPGRLDRHVVMVAAADPHFESVMTLRDLSSLRRDGLELALRLDGQASLTEVHWLEAEAARQFIHEAHQRYRLALAGQRDLTPVGPAWKPASAASGTDGSSEAERHTVAEYAFYRLPDRFQRYVEEHLAPEERILLGLHRPALQSAVQRTFLNRQRLEAGVLVVTDQQAAAVVELMPPDRAGIRYGFVARSGALERLEAVEALALSDDVAGLRLTWRAAGGVETSVWEFPAAERPAVDVACRLLRRWQPQTADTRLRRATPPAPPEPWPALADPAANHPDDVMALAARLEAALAQALCPGETLLARCLLPAWIEGRGAASVLAVTNDHVRVVPDPEDPRAIRLALALPLAAISSLEFRSTILAAYLKAFVPERGRVTEHTIRFASTLAAIRNCYLALRRALAVAPVDRQV